MYRSLLLLTTVLIGFQSSSVAVPMVVWQTDRLTGFDLHISGTLVGDADAAQTESGEFTSPSGNWQVSYTGSHFFRDTGGFTEQSGLASGSFLGFHPFTFAGPGGYGDHADGPGYFGEEPLGLDAQDYSAGALYIYILDGNPEDVSTWTYLVTISLDTPPEYVPESASTLGLLLLASLCLLAFRRRLGPPTGLHLTA